MKKLLTGILAIGIAAALSIPAFAANSEKNDGTAGTDIDINGTFHAGAPAAEVISVDLVWDDMSFTYTEPSRGTWNAAEHKYENATEGGWSWNGATGEKTAPVITLTNHSNIAVKTAFAFNGTVAGLNGTFSKNGFVLATAEGTEVANAPKDETSFSVSGAGIDADKDLGTITVIVADTSTIFTAEELRATANQTGVFKLGCNIDLGTSQLFITSSDYTLDLNGFTLSALSTERASYLLPRTAMSRSRTEPSTIPALSTVGQSMQKKPT